MTKNELENAIMEHLLQIWELMKENSPENMELNMYVNENFASAFNKYWLEENKTPINLWRWLEEGDED